MGGGISFIFPLILLAGMMFFMTRSQKKQQTERQTLLDSMKIGDKVVTIGGLHGIIAELDDNEKTVSIDCEGIILEFDRSAIKTVKPIINEPKDQIEADLEQTMVEDEKVEETVENNKTKE